MKKAFWHVIGIAWFMGHMQHNIRGLSPLSTEETWELSLDWTKGKING